MKKKTPLEKISKTFLSISNLRLKTCVTFGKSDLATNKRISELFLYKYETTKYIDDNVLVGASLETNDFLVIEVFEKKNKESIYLSYQHIFRFQKLIDKAISWLTLEKYEDIYYYNFDNKLSLSITKLKSTLRDLPSNKYISIVPSIIDKEDTNIEKSVLLILNDNLSVNLNLKNLYILKYTLDKFDLFLYSQSLVNYVELLRIKKKKFKPNSSSKGEYNDRKTKR